MADDDVVDEEFFEHFCAGFTSECAIVIFRDCLSSEADGWVYVIDEF